MANKQGWLATLTRDFAKNQFLLFLTLPMVIYILIFKYLPMVGAIVAFKSYRFDQGIFGSRWVGFENFRFFIQSPDLYRLLRNTIAYNLVFLLLNTVLAIILALLLYELTSRWVLKIFQTIIFMPYFLSYVVVAYVLYAFLNPVSGLLNQWLQGFGLETIDWYNKAAAWVYIFPITVEWKFVGLNSLYYYAALMGINSTYFEAAKIDGASKFKMARYISVPSLYPLMTILLILGIGDIVESDFGLFYQLPMNSPTILSTTDVLDTYIFRALISWNDIGMSAAVGLAKSVVGLILIVIANAIVKRINEENTLF